MPTTRTVHYLVSVAVHISDTAFYYSSEGYRIYMLVYAASNINRLNHGICQLTARLQLVAGVQYFSCHVKRLRYVLLCSNAMRL